MATYVAYPARVWTICWQAMNWLAGILQGGAAPPQPTLQAAAATYATLQNGIAAIDAWQAGYTLQNEFLALQGVEALPLVLGPTALAYVTARIAAVAAAGEGMSALAPPLDPAGTIALLAQGQPGVPYPGYLEYCQAFAAEVPPPALTASTLLPACATAAAQAWLTTLQAIAMLQGNSTTPAYDAAYREWRAANLTAGMLAALTSGPPVPFPYGQDIVNDADTPIDNDSDAPFTSDDLLSGVAALAWNQAVALPAILAVATSLNSAPFTFLSQESGTIRYALAFQSAQIALFLLSLRRPAASPPALATLRQNDSLMDLAARSTGSFENWAAIAALNGLQPPYPGPGNQALVGRQLLLPPQNGTPAAGAPLPNYAVDVLGVDLDFGPINGTMPTWTGDYQLISGYSNYARALGRRLQTSLGTLIYHTNYGSRIPPEVGAVQSSDEAARLQQFGRSAILADPRTGAILSSSAQVQPGFAASFAALVQPIGPGSTPVQTNEVIGAS